MGKKFIDRVRCIIPDCKQEITMNGNQIVYIGANEVLLRTDTSVAYHNSFLPKAHRFKDDDEAIEFIARREQPVLRKKNTKFTVNSFNI